MTATETQSPLDAAQNLAPMIRSCADQIEANRELPRPLFEALADAGMSRLALPHVLGGAEINFRLRPSARRDRQSRRQYRLGRQSVRDFRDLRGTDAARHRSPDLDRHATQHRRQHAPPTGQAVVVPGGYRVTGRQGFSSGCRHAAWLAARAHIFENGQPRLKDGQPEERYLFVPAAEAELLDTWHVRGMRGTGTHDFVVSDVFVPAERTVLQAGAPLLETGPLYEIPRSLLFASGDAAVALGLARSCLSAFFELAGAKTPRAMQAMLRDQPLVQAAVGHSEAHLRSGRAFLNEVVCELWTEAISTGTITLDQRAALRLATTHAIHLAVDVVDTVYQAAGVTAIYEGTPMQRYFQDIHVISQHLQGRLSHYELVGKHSLGLKIDQSRL